MPVGAVTNPYGRTKYFIEEILGDLCKSDSEWTAVCLRYFNPIGAHQSGTIGEDPNGIPNNLMPYISQVAIGKLDKLPVFGNDYDTHDGTGVRDYIHVVDLALGHLRALEYALEHTGWEAINLGTGTGYSVLDLINAFEKANGVRVPHYFTSRREGGTSQSVTPTPQRRRGFWAGKPRAELRRCAAIHGAGSPKTRADMNRM